MIKCRTPQSAIRGAVIAIALILTLGLIIYNLYNIKRNTYPSFDVNERDIVHLTDSNEGESCFLNEFRTTNRNILCNKNNIFEGENFINLKIIQFLFFVQCYLIKSKYSLLLILFFVMQVPVKGTFIGENVFSGPGDYSGKSIVKTSDGSYLICGETSSGTIGGSDILFMKVNGSFSFLSTLVLGTEANDHGESIAITNDGGTIIVGYSQFKSNISKALVLRLDNNSNLIWKTYYEGSYAYKVKCLPNGQFAIVGGYYANNHNSWIILLNPRGGRAFSTILSSVDSCSFSLDVLNDNSFITAGRTFGRWTQYDAFLTMVDSSGKKVWEMTYGHPLYIDYFNSVIVGPFSNFVACGYWGDGKKSYVINTRNDGMALWKRYFASSLYSCICKEVVNLPSQNYAAIGSIYSLEKRDYDGLIIQLSSTAEVLYEKIIGGRKEDQFFGGVAEDDEGFTVIGITKSFFTTSEYSSIYIKGGFLYCKIGYFHSPKGCTACPAGTHSVSRLSTKCLGCSPGSYQPKKGKQWCILCPAGTYQRFKAQNKCIDCDEGQYQDEQGAISCKTCVSNYIPNVFKNLCLYKGIFSDESKFTASSFKTNCFDSNLNIIIPYTKACRSAFRRLCCKGSSILSSSGPICNYGLEITSSSSLYNKYCNICPFMDQTQCPAQGVCWNDSLYVDNSYNLKTNFSSACILSIKPYCADKLQINSDNSECFLFKNDCVGANIVSAGYYTNYSSFLIMTKQKLSSEREINDIFNSGVSNATITKISETELQVDISASLFPPSFFQFKFHSLKTICDVYFSESIKHSISMPTLNFTTVLISSSTSPINKCENLIIHSNVTKPYPWVVQYMWTVEYTTIPTPNALLQIVNETKGDTLSLDTEYLIADQTLKVTLKVTTPFFHIITSNSLVLLIKNPNNSPYPCSPCQFYNRAHCLKYDTICWENYLSYSTDYPSLYTEDCLAALSFECNSIWSINGFYDDQCVSYVPYFDNDKMTIKPKVVSIKYLMDLKLKLRIEFNIDIKISILTTCASIFDEETSKLFGKRAQCIWTSARILEVTYSPKKGLITSLKLRRNSVFYNYKFAIKPADDIRLYPTLPDLSDSIQISAASLVSVCRPLVLSAVTKEMGVYEFRYSWKLAYSNSHISPKILSNLEALSKDNKKVLIIPSENLIAGSVLKVTLKVYIFILNMNVVTTKTIPLTQKVPSVSFASSELYELALIGTQTNDLGLIVENNPCNDRNSEDSEITFTINSGTNMTSILTHNVEEIQLENKLSFNYRHYKILNVNYKAGFKYNHYYNLTVCARYQRRNEKSCINKIIGINKPPITAVISGLPTFVTGPLVLNGNRSSIPFEEDEIISLKWQCIYCYSFLSNSECECPFLSESQTASKFFILPSRKLTASCRYQFRLSISSNSGDFSRADSTEAMFVTFPATMLNVEGKIMEGKQNDLYLTFLHNYQGEDSDLSFQYSLIEASSICTSNLFSYSKLNTFIFDLFKNNNVTLNSIFITNDQEIPYSKAPKSITKNTTRIFGIDKSSMVPEGIYTYAVLIKEPTKYSAAIFTVNSPQLPSMRSFDIWPLSGFALETAYIFTFPLGSGKSHSEEIIQILVVNCNEPEKLIYSAVGSTIFEGVLNAGKSECRYQITVILRLSIEQQYVDKNITISVLPSTNSISTAISSLLFKTVKSYTNYLPILCSITLNPVIEVSELAKNNIEKIYDLLCQIEGANNEEYYPSGKEWKSQFLEYSLSIFENLFEHNTESNLNLTMQNLIEEKISSYIDSCETDSINLISTAIRTLSASAGLKKRRGEPQSYLALAKTLEKIRKIGFHIVQPDGLPIEVFSPSVSLKIVKQYGNYFNLPHEITNTVAQNYYNVSYFEKAETRVELPGGLTTKILNNHPDIEKYKATLLICTSLISLKFNPYTTVKTNSFLSISSISPLSFNSDLMDISGVQNTYRDFTNHRYNNTIDIYRQNTDLVQLTFNASRINKNGSITDYEEEIRIGTLENEGSVMYFHPYSSPKEFMESSIIIPFYKEPDYWTNLNCSLRNVNDLGFTTECKILGSQHSRYATNILVDIVSNSPHKLQKSSSTILYPSFSHSTLKSLSILILCRISVFLLIITLYILYRKDKIMIPKLQIAAWKYFMSNSAHSRNSKVAVVISLIKFIQRKGMKTYLDERAIILSQQNPQTDSNVSDHAKIMKRNSMFSEDEMLQLKNLFTIYEINQNVLRENDILELLNQKLQSFPSLFWKTRDYIEDTMLGMHGFFLILLQHNLFSAFYIKDFYIYRPIKLFIFSLILFGEFSITGLLCTYCKNNYSQIIIYSLSSIAFCFCVKFLFGQILSEYYSQEIVHSEKILYELKRSALVKKIGLILGSVILILELSAILFFSVSFNDFEIDVWLIMFGITVIIDNIILFMLKIGMQFLCVYFFQKLLSFFNTQQTCVKVLLYFIESIMKIFLQYDFQF